MAGTRHDLLSSCCPCACQAFPTPHLSMYGLHQLISSSQALGCHHAALFFADKLVSVFPDQPEHALRLASILFQQRDFRRAYNVLMKLPPPMSVKSRLLATQCLIELKEWDAALNLIGDYDDEMVRESSSPQHFASKSNELNPNSALCFCRGVIYEALENRRKAVHWFKQALLQDVTCYDAFRRLIHERMLPVKEERAFVQDLDFPRDLEWLKIIYLCEIDQFDHTNEKLSSDIAVLSKYNLHENNDVVVCVAQGAYVRDRLKTAKNICNNILEKDAFHHNALLIMIGCLVHLGQKSELFYLAHQLVDTYPGQAISWYCVGSYYYLIHKYELARRYLSKSYTADASFAAAWIAYGHSFAAQNESDQAMSAYRMTERLLSGSHLPSLYLGMEHLKTNNLKSAHSFIVQSLTICPTDPYVYNELGVVHYANAEYIDAIHCFEKVVELVSPDAYSEWETAFFNLGHCYRKINEYEKALDYYETAKSLNPYAASVHSAIGFTYHLQREYHTAIDNYHKALSIKPGDVLANDLLCRALSELFSKQC